MNEGTEGSRALFERSRSSLIEGGSSASRGPANFGAYPLYMERADGAYLFDVDGNRYLDWMMGFGVVGLGHAHPEVVAAISQGASEGAHYATSTPIEVEVAEMILSRLPAADKIRFANTGTEAVMAAVRLARGYTGRPKIIKFEGHYHGWYDDVLVSSNPQLESSLGHRRDPVKIADSSGLNRRALDDTIVVPWNDLEALERVLASQGPQVAAVLSEGIMANMGVIPPHPGYLEGLRELAHHHGALFILDETVTGFRISPGGCQTHYGVAPDISTFGKALGSGLPVAALVGREEIMQSLAWGGVLHYGSQNASRLGLFAARASFQVMTRDDDAAFRHIWEVGENLCRGLEDLFRETGTPALVQRVGPMFQVLFTERESIEDYRDYCAHVDRLKYKRFVWALFRQGVYMTPSAALHSVVTTAHTEAEVEFTLEAARKALADVG